MGRLAVAFLLLASAVALPAAVRLPVTLAGCIAVSLAYHGNFFRLLLRFFLLWLAFFCAVAAGRAWAGAGWRVLVLDGAGTLGLALGVACSVLLAISGAPAELLRGLDRMRVPREFSYAVLALVRLLPEVAAVGARQLALLRLKGVGAGGIAQRFRAYPRIVAPLFGILLNRQLAHVRSLAQRGFFAPGGLHDAPHAAAPGALLTVRDGLLAGLLVGLAALGFGVAAWIG